MEKGEVESYFRSLLNQLRRHFLKVRQTPDEPSIHDLRVHLKKLQAFYLLLGYIHPRSFKPKKEFKAFRKLFKVVGKTRDSQVPQLVLKNYESKLNVTYPDWHNELKRRERRDKRIFRSWLDSNNMSSAIQRQLMKTQLFNSTSSAQFTRKGRVYVRELLQRLNEMALRKDARSKHRKRILLKRIRFVIESLKEVNPEFHSYDGLLKKVKLLEQILGDWHDLVIMSDQLKSYNGSSAGSDQYVHLNKALQNDRRILLSASNHYLRQLFG